MFGEGILRVSNLIAAPLAGVAHEHRVTMRGWMIRKKSGHRSFQGTAGCRVRQPMEQSMIHLECFKSPIRPPQHCRFDLPYSKSTNNAGGLCVI